VDPAGVEGGARASPLPSSDLLALCDGPAFRLADWTGGNSGDDRAGRNIVRDHGTRGNHGALTYCDPGQDDTVYPDECTSADACLEDSFGSATGVSEGLIVRQNRRTGCHGRTFLDDDFFGIEIVDDHKVAHLR